MHPHSSYAAYHIPTASLRICLAETVLRQYKHMGKNWTQQQSLTVNFTGDLTARSAVRGSSPHGRDEIRLEADSLKPSRTSAVSRWRIATSVTKVLDLPNLPSFPGESSSELAC
jgi:hypothetical protein